MRCGDSFHENRARGCRLPPGHFGPCDAMTGRFDRAPAAPDLDDPSEDVMAAQDARDDELRREES